MNVNYATKHALNAFQRNIVLYAHKDFISRILNVLQNAEMGSKLVNSCVMMEIFKWVMVAPINARLNLDTYVHKIQTK